MEKIMLVDDLSCLQVGDVIDMNKPKDGKVRVFVGRQPWFTGKMGVYKKNMAVSIEERIYVEQEEDNRGKSSDK